MAPSDLLDNRMKGGEVRISPPQAVVHMGLVKALDSSEEATVGTVSHHGMMKAKVLVPSQVWARLRDILAEAMALCKGWAMLLGAFVVEVILRGTFAEAIVSRRDLVMRLFAFVVAVQELHKDSVLAQCTSAEEMLRGACCYALLYEVPAHTQASESASSKAALTAAYSRAFRYHVSRWP